MPATKTRIIRIGNSQGVRIPRNLLEQVGMVSGESSNTTGQEVELQIEGEAIIIRRLTQVRNGWEEAFERMALQGDDELLDDVPGVSSWDDSEWTW